jgi:hypothetical protein
VIVCFVGRVRIVDATQRDGNALPYTVEVFDDETDERNERLERKFGTAAEAHAYARMLTLRSPAPDLMVPIVLVDEPQTRWSISAVISAEI